MADEGILRLFGFRPLRSGAELDAALREEVLPGFLAAAGILDAYVARSGTDVAGERVMASMWESRDAMTAEIGDASVIGRFHPERIEDLTTSRLDILPLVFSVRHDREEPPIILRVYRGLVRPGELDAYVEEARDGTLLDAESNKGLVALYLATEPPARFITVSAWTDLGLDCPGDRREHPATRGDSQRGPDRRGQRHPLRDPAGDRTPARSHGDGRQRLTDYARGRVSCRPGARPPCRRGTCARPSPSRSPPS